MRASHLFNFSIIALTALSLASCGGKKNKAPSNLGGDGLMVGTNPLLGQNGSLKSSIQYLEGQLPCQFGGQRVYKRFSSSQVQGNHTTIAGQFTDGQLNSGVVDSQIYVGANSNSRDLLYIQKVVNGQSVIGYNAVLSFCQIPNVISADRNLIRLRINSANLDNDAHCGFGSIDAASTFVFSVKDTSQNTYFPYGCGGGNYYPNNPYIATYGICTNFTKIACNGKY